jgi:hypothetical protein
MTISFRHHQTRIDKRSQPDQRIKRNATAVRIHDHTRTGLFIKHPTRNIDAQFLGITFPFELLNADDHRRHLTPPDRAKDSHPAIKKRMKKIGNPRRPQLAGSVWIR